MEVPSNDVGAKPYSFIKSFSASTAAAADSAAQAFIDSLTADATQTYQVTLLQAYHDGTNHVRTIMYGYYTVLIPPASSAIIAAVEAALP